MNTVFWISSSSSSKHPQATEEFKVLFQCIYSTFKCDLQIQNSPRVLSLFLFVCKHVQIYIRTCPHKIRGPNRASNPQTMHTERHVLENFTGGSKQARTGENNTSKHREQTFHSSLSGTVKGRFLSCMCVLNLHDIMASN